MRTSGRQADAGRFVVGDFVTGRLWAVPVPSDDQPVRDADVLTLGAWDLLPSAFTVGPGGEVFLADFGRSRILVIEPAAGAAPTE